MIRIFNDYKVEGEVTKLILKRRKEEDLECLIDTKYLENLKNMNITWFAKWTKSRIRDKVFYVCGTQYLGLYNGKPKYKTLYLHRVILNMTNREYGDHYNHNTLDNREENLRPSSNSDNSKHRKGLNSNNKSGYRNVCWINNKWCVQLQIDGKNKILGKFDDVHEAGRFASEMRKKYYGEFKGN